MKLRRRRDKILIMVTLLLLFICFLFVIKVIETTVENSLYFKYRVK